MSQAAEALDISAEVARIHATAYECEDELVTTILDPDAVICVLRTALSPFEELLIARHHDAVHERRQAVEHALAPAMSGAVERATGRRVAAFHASTHFDPNVTLLMFRLAAAAPGFPG